MYFISETWVTDLEVVQFPKFYTTKKQCQKSCLPRWHTLILNTIFMYTKRSIIKLNEVLLSFPSQFITKTSPVVGVTACAWTNGLICVCDVIAKSWKWRENSFPAVTAVNIAEYEEEETRRMSFLWCFWRLKNPLTLNFPLQCGTC